MSSPDNQEVFKVETEVTRALVVWIALVVGCGEDAIKAKTEISSTNDAGYDTNAVDEGTQTDVGDPTPACDVACGEGAVCTIVQDVPSCICMEGYFQTDTACEYRNSIPLFSNLPHLEYGVPGESDTFQIQAADPDLNDSMVFSLESTTCPFDIQVDAGTGLAEWTCPETPIQCESMMKVEDTVGRYDQQHLWTWCELSLPIFAGSPPTRLWEDAEYRYQPSCSDPQGLPVTLSVSDTDTCGGQMVGDSYVWTPSEIEGGIECIMAVECTNGNLTAIESTALKPFESNRTTLMSPIPDHSSHWSDSVSIQASATDDDLPPQELVFSLYSTRCAYPVDVSPSGEITYVCGANLGNCEIIVQVDDGHATLPPQQTFIATCTNTAPVTSNVQISPAAPTTPGQLLTCTYTYTDAENDPDLSVIEWITPTVLERSPTFSNYVDLDEVYCRVVGKDGASRGLAALTSITCCGP